MNCKLYIFILHLIASTYTLSVGRYNNRVLARYDTIERHRRQHKEVKVVGDCLFNICEHVSYYPEEEVRSIIEKHKSLHSYFGGSVIEPVKESFAISSRNHNEPPEPFCKTKDVSTIPKLMTDIDNVQRAIANTDIHKQVIKYQICDFDGGEECYTGNLLNISTKCVQKFNVIKLMAVNLTTNSLEYRKFQIPSTCICTYTKNY